MSDLDRLASDLKALSDVAPQMRDVVQTSATRLRNAWRANARASSGKHGRLYPGTITYETKAGPAGAFADIGPESGRPQGGMGRGFEYGSVNQPPHLDGTKAAKAEEPLFQAAIKTAEAGFAKGRGL